MSGDALSGDGVQAAADLGRRTAEAQVVQVRTGDAELDRTLVARVIPADERLTLQDLEAKLPNPRTPRGQATLDDPASFAAYVSRMATRPATTVWCNERNRTVTAVFNDHHPETPGWRDHSACFVVRPDPDWTAWNKRNGQLTDQTSFGEFLEDQAHTIAEPPAAELLMIAMTLTAKRNLQFDSSVRLQSGDISFGYIEETSAKANKGRLEVPERFTLRMAPFRGADPIAITARLRYRISPDGLKIGYRLQRPDLAEQEAFDELIDEITANIPSGVPMLAGQAPEALR